MLPGLATDPWAGAPDRTAKHRGRRELLHSQAPCELMSKFRCCNQHQAGRMLRSVNKVLLHICPSVNRAACPLRWTMYSLRHTWSYKFLVTGQARPLIIAYCKRSYRRLECRNPDPKVIGIVRTPVMHYEQLVRSWPAFVVPMSCLARPKSCKTFTRRIALADKNDTTVYPRRPGSFSN